MAIKNLNACLPTILAFALISAMNTCQSERVKKQSQMGTMTSFQEIEIKPEEVFQPIDQEIIESKMNTEPVIEEKINRIP